jgi:hypothetical protein
MNPAVSSSPDAGEHLIEKTCDSNLEPGECFFCTGPETD